jgi:hypothetical protein
MVIFIIMVILCFIGPLLYSIFSIIKNKIKYKSNITNNQKGVFLVCCTCIPILNIISFCEQQSINSKIKDHYYKNNKYYKIFLNEPTYDCKYCGYNEDKKRGSYIETIKYPDKCSINKKICLGKCEIYLSKVNNEIEDEYEIKTKKNYKTLKQKETHEMLQYQKKYNVIGVYNVKYIYNVKYKRADEYREFFKVYTGNNGLKKGLYYILRENCELYYDIITESDLVMKKIQ